MKIGIGSKGGYTERLARELFMQKDLAKLNLQLSEHAFTEQVDLLLSGQLDLAMFVVSENNSIIGSAINKGLQIYKLPKILVRDIKDL